MGPDLILAIKASVAFLIEVSREVFAFIEALYLAVARVFVFIEGLYTLGRRTRAITLGASGRSTMVSVFGSSL